MNEGFMQISAEEPTPAQLLAWKRLWGILLAPAEHQSPAKYRSSWKGVQICLTLRRPMAISCPALTVLLGGDRHGTRPQVLIAHCPLPRRAPDLGPLATVDHDCRRAGPTWED